MASGLILLSVIAAAGAVAGVVSGLLGIGGGIILVPALLYVFGAMGYHFDQIMQVCVATSTGTIIFNSLRAIHGHSKRGAVDFGLMRSWGPFIAIGSVLGVLVATALHSRELQLVFGCIGFALGLYMAFGRRDWRISDVLPGPGLRSVYASLIGFFSAIMGIGGGSFTVPLLSAYSVPPHRAVATSSGFGLLISIPAFVAFLASGWLQAFWEVDLQPYDVGAGILLLRETGCECTSFSGKPYCAFRNRSLVAGFPGAAAELRAIAAQAYGALRE